MFEVKSIIEDFRMQAIGGMMAAWHLWERAMVPSLLSGAKIALRAETRMIGMKHRIWEHK